MDEQSGRTNGQENSVKLVGNLGGDPKVRKAKTGEIYAAFILGNHLKRPNTEWIQVMAWGEELVTTAKELKSGDEVRVEGYIHSWWPGGTLAWRALPSTVVNAEVLRLIQPKAAPQDN